MNGHNEDSEDSVDMLGLDEFGAPGGAFGQKTGAAIGAGLQAGGAWAVRALMPSWSGKSEIAGTALGVLGGLAMMATRKGKAAAGVVITSALVGGGIRVLEQLFSSNPPIALDGVVVDPAAVLRGTVVNRTQVLRGGGLGLTTATPTRAFAGAKAQMAGALPQLNGRAEQVRLNGGPQISGLAEHYGASLFGSR